MKRITTCLLLLGLFACNGAESQEVEDLTRRISQLEKKVKTLEQAAKGGKASQKGKGKAGAEKTAKAGAKGEKAGAEKGSKAEKGGKAGEAALSSITAEGDASKVVLTQGKKRLPLPGKAPAGTYTVMAAFGEAPLAKAGEVTVQARKSLTVTCSSADKTCAGS